MKLYVYSPVDVATGGTELLQQFCSVARSVGVNAVMYYRAEYKDTPVEKRFGEYCNPYVNEIEDQEGNTIVVPETAINVLNHIKHCKKAIWWLSVDNYLGAPSGLYWSEPHGVRRKIKRALYRLTLQYRRDIRHIQECVNLFQSEYARAYLMGTLGVESSSLTPLSDYINTRFLNECDYECERRDVVLYNPKKGLKYTRMLMRLYPEVQWIALTGMTGQQLAEIMHTAKIYIDFGNHPGKDRMPREAAICGCCVITGKRGSAGNDIDVPIPSDFKFDENATCQEVGNRIRQCLTHFTEESHKFDSYRQSILQERSIFVRETKNVLELLF